MRHTHDTNGVEIDFLCLTRRVVRCAALSSFISAFVRPFPIDAALLHQSTLENSFFSDCDSKVIFIIMDIPTDIPALVTTSLVVVAAVFPALSLCSILLRYRSRRISRQPFKSDDYWIVASWV